MPEIIARIGQNSNVELTLDGIERIENISLLSPEDAAYLGRSMIACAAALSGQNQPAAGALVGDAHLPIMRWAVGTSRTNLEPIIVLSIPSGIELTFQMPAQTARELGQALLDQTGGTEPLAGQSGHVH